MNSKKTQELEPSSVLQTLLSFLLLLFIMGTTTLIHTQTMEIARIPSDADIKKITSAMPDISRVKPIEKRRVLVFSMSHKYYHNCILIGKEAFTIMGEKTQAFETVVSDDIAMFEPENLKTFDAIIFNNAYFEMFISYTNIAKGYFVALDKEAKKKVIEYDQRLKNSLVAFIQNGKGLVLIHAAVASLENWPEYGRIIGARFDGHPWKDIDVTFKVDHPEHPLTQAFKSNSFVLNDEIYQVKDPYSRDNLNVLVSIDTTKTDMSRKGINREDGDFGITWVKKYGKGRVFYCALGHNPELYWNPMILQHYLDGIQYAIGDLKLDK
jgi:type 1 glutamine amidotransferase